METEELVTPEPPLELLDEKYLNKCKNRYHRAGIPYCWIIDANAQIGYECHREGPHPNKVEILTAEPVIQIPVAQIFEEAAAL